MQRVLILGAGGHGQVVADVLLAAQAAGEPIAPIGFLDDDPATWATKPFDLPVYGSLAEIDRRPHDAVVIGIGDNRARHMVVEALRVRAESYAIAIHPRAIIGRRVEVGWGTVICGGAVVNTGTIIGEHVILNTACSVDHHNRIGSFAHIAPGSHLGGDVTVGEGTLVGIGATVMPQRTIGTWATVGAGAVVTTSLGDRVVAAGVPARPIQKA